MRLCQPRRVGSGRVAARNEELSLAAHYSTFIFLTERIPHGRVLSVLLRNAGVGELITQ